MQRSRTRLRHFKGLVLAVVFGTLCGRACNQLQILQAGFVTGSRSLLASETRSRISSHAVPDVAETALASSKTTDLLSSDILAPLVLGAVALVGAVIASGVFSLGRKDGFLQEGIVLKRIILPPTDAVQVRQVNVPEELTAGWPKYREEWRVLRFEPCVMYLQGVTRLRWNNKEPDADPEVMDQVLSLPYNQSLASVTMSALQLIGAPAVEAMEKLPEGKEVEKEPLLRFLFIGLGGGAMPAFFKAVFPQSSVDVVEIEPAVLEAAEEVMGFKQSKQLKCFVEDGAEFALNAAMKHGPGVYDAVVIDAFEPDGNLPEVMWKPGGGLSKAIANGLLREPGLVAVNFLPGTNLEPRVDAYREAMKAAGATPGIGFSATAPEENLMTVQTCCARGGSPPKVEDFRERLQEAGEEIARRTEVNFDIPLLATQQMYFW